MHGIQLIKRKQNSLSRVISLIFVLSGANFFMNYLLPTNPQSKNKLIKKLWKEEAFRNVNTRYKYAYHYGIIHVIFATCMAIDGKMWSILNILVNIYPIIIQLFIGYRCFVLKNNKLKLNGN